MPRTLRRRSLQPQTELPPPAQLQPPDTAQQSVDDPALTVELLTSIPGIGAVVASRVIGATSTVSQLWARWDTAGKFAKEIQGLSAAGASKIWDKLRTEWPSLAPDGQAETAIPTTAELVPLQIAPEPVEEVITPTSSLPPPYNSFSLDQLEALLPTLEGDIEKQVVALLAREKNFVEEVIKEEEPTLPAPYDGFNPEQLTALLPTITEAALIKQIEAYLDWASPVPTVTIVQPENLPQPAAPVEIASTPLPQPITSPTINILGFFKQEAERYSAGGTTSTKTPFIKLSGGHNKLRLLGPYKSGYPPFRQIKTHTWRATGRTQFGLCYKWILSDDSMMQFLMSQGKISEQDIMLAKRLGDPLQELPMRLANANRKDEAKNLWARTRYLWNAIDRDEGTLCVFESSKTFFDSIGGLLTVYPNLFDHEKGHDIQINGNKLEGTARRYSSPIAIESSPSGVSKDSVLYDLDNVASRKTKSWSEKATALFSNYGELAASVGMTEQDWLPAPNSDPF